MSEFIKDIDKDLGTLFSNFFQKILNNFYFILINSIYSVYIYGIYYF